MKFINFFLLASVCALIGACSKPVKTYEYFQQHPEEIQIEGKRCLEASKQGKVIAEDENCSVAIFAESERCIARKRAMGGATDFIPINCENPWQMLAFAAEGF